MELIPAIDLRGGRCVRLLQGHFDAETHYPGDPLELARAYHTQGAGRLHIVDLDGARDGTPANLDLISRLAALPGIALQVGGGVRSEDRFTALLAVGVARHVNDHAVAEAEQLIDAHLRFHARLRAGPDVGRREHAVAAVKDLGGRVSHLIPRLTCLFEVAHDSLPAMVGGGVRDLGKLFDYALRMPQQEPRVAGEVAVLSEKDLNFGPVLEQLLHDLHVLLRHRLLLQAHGFDRFLPREETAN